MAQPGEVIEHPSFGTRIKFLQTAEQTSGELLRVEVTLPPGFSMPEHVHPQQEERHEVLSGTLRARVGGKERDYNAGERVIGPPGGHMPGEIQAIRRFCASSLSTAPRCTWSCCSRRVRASLVTFPITRKRCRSTCFGQRSC